MEPVRSAAAASPIRRHRHANTAQPGHQKVAELVEEDHESEDEQEWQAPPASDDAEGGNVIKKAHGPIIPDPLPTNPAS